MARETGGPKGNAKDIVDTKFREWRWLEGASLEFWAAAQRRPGRRSAPQGEAVTKTKQQRALVLCA